MTVIDQELVITSLKSVTQDISVYGEDFLGFYQFSILCYYVLNILPNYPL